MFIMLLMFFVGAVLGNLTVGVLQFAFGHDFVTAYGNVISYPLMFLPAIIYAALQSRKQADNVSGNALDTYHVGRLGRMIPVLMAVSAVLATAYVVEPIVTLLPQMPQWLEDVMKQLLDKSPLWMSIISVSVFAPLFEEWLCRGIILRGLLANRISPVSAIVTSSIFFAVLHLNPWQAVPAFLLGCLFGYVYYKTGSLKLTMLMHCVNNSAAVLFSKMSLFKDADTFMDVLSPGAYWTLYAVCLLVVAGSVAVFSRTGYRK